MNSLMCGKSIFLNQLLSFTALNGHLQICQLINRYIVEIPWRGYIPFHFAAKFGQLEICQLIMGEYLFPILYFKVLK